MKHFTLVSLTLFASFYCVAQQKQKDRILRSFLENKNEQIKATRIDLSNSSDSMKSVRMRDSLIYKPNIDTLLFANENRASKRLAQNLFTPLATSNSAFINDNASISLESQFGDQFASASAGYTNRNYTFGAEVKQPFQEKPQKVNPFSLDGLDNGASFKIGLQRNFWKLKSDKEIEEILNKIKEEYYLKTHFELISITCSNLVTVIKDNESTYYYKKDGISIKIDSLEKRGCCCSDKSENYQLYGFYLKDGLSDNDKVTAHSIDFLTGLDSTSKALFFERIQVKKWFIGGSAAISKNSFDYIKDSFAVAPTVNETHLNQSYKLNIGFIFNPEDKNKMSVLAFSAVYSLGFETGSDPIDYNFPVGTQGLSYTKNVSIGNPSQTTNKRVALEWRKRINLFQHHPLAISPSLTYLFDKKSLSVTLPVYIFQYKKDEKIAGLQGGFRLAYITKTNEAKLTSFSKGFSASVFIAAPFDLFSF